MLVLIVILLLMLLLESREGRVRFLLKFLMIRLEWLLRVVGIILGI
jgi:hypothetical protein